MSITFHVNFDTRTKEVLLACLGKEMALVEERITTGDYSTEAMTAYEELLRIRRGILYAPPQEVDDVSNSW